jgi:hypothetical protein
MVSEVEWLPKMAVELLLREGERAERN